MRDVALRVDRSISPDSRCVVLKRQDLRNLITVGVLGARKRHSCPDVPGSAFKILHIQGQNMKGDLVDWPTRIRNENDDSNGCTVFATTTSVLVIFERADNCD